MRGSGCVPIFNLMEDAATCEISRTQIWQWIHHPTGVLALSDDCTHQKCTVDYLPERQLIFCPCHGAQFSTTGESLRTQHRSRGQSVDRCAYFAVNTRK